MKKSLLNIRKIPFWEVWILDRGLLVKKLIKRKKGQDYVVWDENGFILPRISDKPFSVQDRFGTVLYYHLENTLCLQEYTLPGEIRMEIEEVRREIKEKERICEDLTILVIKGSEKISKEFKASKELSKLEKETEKAKSKIEDLERQYQFIKKTDHKNLDSLITAINPTVMKTLLEETSLTKVLAQEKEWWEAFKYPILIGVVGFLVIYLVSILDKIL